MYRLLFTASLLLLIFPLSALGATSTEFVKVETDKFDDADLVGVDTYAMRVTADTDWTNSDMTIELTIGSMNHIESGGFAGGPEAAPQGLGDTAVFSPVTSLGDITSGAGANTAVDHTETPTTFAASWFDVVTDDIGIFDIAMITISNDANGELRFRTISGRLVEEGGFTIGTSPTWVIRDGGIARDLEPADLNMDGFVDSVDLGVLLGNFHQNGITASGGELNGTDPVDSLDLGLLLGAWDPPPLPTASSVPEPSTLMLAGLVTIGLFAPRGRCFV